MLRDRTKDRVDQLRPVGVVSVHHAEVGSYGPRESVGGKLYTTKINADAYRKGVGLERAMMPIRLTARKASEWRGTVVLVSVDIKHA